MLQLTDRVGANVSLLEPLEPRCLLSGAPESYNLMSLLGYDRRGASWKYNTVATYVDLDDQTTTRSQSTKVNIATAQAKFDGQLSNVVKFYGPDVTLTSAWYSNSKGTFQSLSFTSGAIGELNITLHDTKIAPKSMVVGQTYHDTGTFDGRINDDVLGESLTGTFSGNDTVTSGLSRHQTIRTKAGSYDAIKGSYEVTVTGKLKLNIAGETINVDFSADQNTVFWAVPNVGVAKHITSATVTYQAPDQDPFSTKLDETSSLASYVLP